MLMMEPTQQAAFVANIAAAAAVQSTTARWLAALCSATALYAPKTRRSHVCLDLSQRWVDAEALSRDVDPAAERASYSSVS